ncbi:VpsF family polysaccharide biosynthesis protein [Chitinophaga cymbidii]|uniref:O-antigen polymerase n=1 Tax=Chitinophaga cymbidii TaxID=1096750 RepID=A0A512RP27_9BACT|nr:VpsF family polysaccharide biosynthesis protein [Chitinophaga cymbidii]GEP97449.1 hypothetical protein CCY01nite_37090 [Chitinophaga cymbidii]
MRNTAYITNRYLLIFVTVLCFLGIGLLGAVGYTMGKDASSAVTKIHPLSYVLLFISMLNLMRVRDKEQILRGLSYNKPEYQLLFFIGVIVFYLYLIQNLSSISFIVDTLVCPALLAINFRYYPERFKWSARKLCLQLLMINAYVAIAERLLSMNFFPIVTTFGEEFRSTALLGHPLNNALITFVGFLYAAVVPLPVTRKLYTMTVLLIAMVCFGARGALYASMLSLVLLFIVPVFTSRKAYFKKISRPLIITMLTVMIMLVVYLILYTSFGERLVEASFYDSSSEVRARAFDIIDLDNLGNYFFAKDQAEMDMLSYYADVEIIENFFIFWVLKFGLILAVGLCVMIYRLFYLRMPIQSSFKRHVVVLLLLLAAATNNSLNTNTQLLSIFVLFFTIPDTAKAVHTKQ